MLQLFAAAQDVFYVSYQGSDPRDGSVREPSVLVGDLLAAVEAQHAPDARPGDAFVVRHPLQPFAPAAFGGADEPRRFSYRQAWWPAAARPEQRRVALPAWFGGDALPAPDTDTDPAAEARVSLDALRRFLQAPAQAFLQQRLGVRLAEVDAPEDDIEPLLAPGRGLARHALQQAVFEAHLRGDHDAAVHARLRAAGLLPTGPLGLRALEQVRGEVAPFADALRAWRGDRAPGSVPLEVGIDGVVLHGRLADCYPHGIARVRFAAPHGPSAIRNGLDWLAASAAGIDAPLVEFHDDPDAGPGPHLREALDPDTARALLGQLLALRARGLREPLPFAPYAGWEVFKAPSLGAAIQNAAKKWHGHARGWAEGEAEGLRLAMRGRDPFTDAATQVAFVDLSLGIYQALVHGVAYTGTDPEALRALAAGLDLEEVE